MISYRGRVLREMVAPLMFSALFGFFEEVIVVVVYRLARWAVTMKKTFPEPVAEAVRLEA